jgi:hemerythrin-like domain-containing protein
MRSSDDRPKGSRPLDEQSHVTANDSYSQGDELTAFKNDMTMMYAVHDALRRELDRIARVTARTDDDPKHVLRTAVGWEMFKSYLHLHHTSEDELLWPPLRKSLAEGSHAIALLDVMEAEHAAIDPLLAAVDAALADRDSGPGRLGELADALAFALREHLGHEEREGLPLIDATITAAQWQTFGAEGAKLISGDVSRFMPWMLEGAAPEVTASVLGMLPPPVQHAYRDQWQPDYANLNLWG